MKYSKTVNSLLPSPYQTNCFDYTIIGCKARADCVNKCNIERALKQCQSLPHWTNVDGYNNKDKYNNNNPNMSLCVASNFNYSICENKYKSPDCINEFFSMKVIFDAPINQSYEGKMHSSHLKSVNPHIDINLIIHLKISVSDDLDTIYSHSPQQYIIEFICFVGGIISLWTGFSVLSLYAFGKRFFVGQNNQINSMFTRRTKTVPIKKKTNEFRLIGLKKFGKRMPAKNLAFGNEIVIKTNSSRPMRGILQTSPFPYAANVWTMCDFGVHRSRYAPTEFTPKH